jgi:hypothetical protein
MERQILEDRDRAVVASLSLAEHALTGRRSDLSSPALLAYHVEQLAVENAQRYNSIVARARNVQSLLDKVSCKSRICIVLFHS